MIPVFLSSSFGMLDSDTLFRPLSLQFEGHVQHVPGQDKMQEFGNLLHKESPYQLLYCLAVQQF